MLVIDNNSGDIILLNAQTDTSIDTAPTIEELIVELAHDDYHKAGSLHIGKPNSEFTTEQQGLLVRKSVVD